jgi:hypothetical protein
MKKRCRHCGCPFDLSGSGRRQIYCQKCQKEPKRVIPFQRNLPASNALKTKAAETDFGSPIPMPGSPQFREFGERIKEDIEMQIGLSKAEVILPEGVFRISFAFNADGSPKIGDALHYAFAARGAIEGNRMRQPKCAEKPEPEPVAATGIRLQGDDYPLTFDADGYPILPACLDRRRKPQTELEEAA